MEEDYKNLGMEKEYIQDVVIYNLNKFIEYCNKPHYFEYTHDFKQHKEVAGYLEALINRYRELEAKVKEIRDKAEVMDYYTLPDVIEDLNKLLGDEE